MNAFKKRDQRTGPALMREAHQRYQITESLTIHQDRGSPMTVHAYLDLLGDLSVTPSHSRQRVAMITLIQKVNSRR